MKYDSIIFDLDGTLWDAVDNILISWNEVLVRHGIKEITKDELSHCMGMEMTAIAAKLFPQFDEEKRNALLDECSENELDYLTEHGGYIFEGMTEVIKSLSKNYRLFICSNCQKGYIECFLKSSGLDEYFEDRECWGNTGKPKADNIKLLIKHNSLKSPLYVGDTAKDEHSAHLAGIDFCFAAYGFGKSDKHEYIINSPSDLLNIL